MGNASETGSVAPVADGELRRPGALVACSDMSRPPMEYRGSDGARRGFEVDLVEEIALRLRLRPVWVDASRSEIIDSVAHGRCDAAVSTLPVDLGVETPLGPIGAISYLAVPISLLVREGERASVTTGLCGRRIGVFARTREAELLREYSKLCQIQGLKALRAIPMQRTPEALDELSAGRIDGIVDELPVNRWYARRQTDRFELAWILADEDVRYAIGYGSGKNSLYLGIRSALAELHSDGTFDDLMRRWGLDRAGAVPLPLP